MSDRVVYQPNLENKQQMHPIHLTAPMGLPHPHSHSMVSAQPSHLVPASSSYGMVPGDVDVQGMDVPGGGGVSDPLMSSLFDPSVPFTMDVNDEQQLDAHLLELSGMVLNIQSTLLQFIAVTLLSPNVNSRFQEAAMKRVAQFRKQLSSGNKKLLKIQSLLADDRKDSFDHRSGFGSLHRMPTNPLSNRTPNKRGRGRLLKCEKHRRWKKRCPMDCPDKPSNSSYADDDGEEDEDGQHDEDDGMDHVMHASLGPPGALLGNLNGMGAGRPSLHPPPPIQLSHMPPPHMHPHSHLVPMGSPHLQIGLQPHLGMQMMRPSMISGPK